MATFYNCKKCNFYNDADDYVCVECGTVNIYDMSKPDDNLIPKVDDKDDDQVPTVIPDDDNDTVGNIPIELNFDNIPLPDDISETTEHLDFTAASSEHDENPLIASQDPQSDQAVQEEQHVIDIPVSEHTSVNYQEEEEESPLQSTLSDLGDGVCIDARHIGDLFPNIFVKLKQNIVSEVASQLKQPQECSTILKGFTNNPLLTLITLILWSLFIFWVVSLHRYYHTEDPDKSLRNTYRAARIILVLAYGFYISAFFPLIDFKLRLRSDPICHSLYEVDDAYTTPVTPTQAAVTVRNEVISKSAVVRINQDYLQADIANNKGTDEQVGFNGNKLIELLSAAHHSMIYLHVSVYTTFTNQQAVADACLRHYHNDVLLLSEKHAEVEFPETQHIALRVMPSRLNQPISGSSDYTRLQDDSEASVQDTPSGWLLWNPFCHFIFFLLMIEPIYIGLWHYYIKSIVVSTEREWRLVNPARLQEQKRQQQEQQQVQQPQQQAHQPVKQTASKPTQGLSTTSSTTSPPTSTFTSTESTPYQPPVISTPQESDENSQQGEKLTRVRTKKKTGKYKIKKT